MADSDLDEVMSRLAEMEDPAVRAVNLKHSDEHGVNLSRLRGLAKELKKQPDLARQLWATSDSSARLLAILISRPKDFSADEYAAMMRQARTPKEQDWLLNYLVAKSSDSEELRRRWFEDPAVASAAWALTSTRVAKDPEGLDIEDLLDRIEADMKHAPERLQWAMNTCLGTIGIHRPEHRARVLDIGERLEVLKDYPTPRGCVSPYVPLWVAEIVSRQEEQSRA